MIFNLQTVIVDETDAKAQAKWQDYKQYINPTARWRWFGLDRHRLRRISARRAAAPHPDQCGAVLGRGLLDGRSRPRSGRCANSPTGSASAASGRCSSAARETVADQLEEWVDDTDVDGFNLAYAVTHETFSDIVAISCRNCSGAASTSATTRRARCAKSCSAPDRACRPAIRARATATSDEPWRRLPLLSAAE